MNSNTKIILNRKVIFLNENSKGQLALKFFNLLYKIAKEIILNDDGGEEFKHKLKEFDISKDKTFGNDWHFTVNNKSKELFKKVLMKYSKKQWGFLKWSLIGDDFKVDYEEVGDEMVYPEYAKKGIYNLFKINAKGKSLEVIEMVLRGNSDKSKTVSPHRNF